MSVAHSLGKTRHAHSHAAAAEGMTDGAEYLTEHLMHETKPLPAGSVMLLTP